MTIIGTCDVCCQQNVEIRCVTVVGIETWCCADIEACDRFRYPGDPRHWGPPQGTRGGAPTDEELYGHTREMFAPMTTLTPQQIADLKASIAAKYKVSESSDVFWWVVRTDNFQPVNDTDHDDPLDAEAELEAIIQDEVKAAIEEMDGSAT